MEGGSFPSMAPAVVRTHDPACGVPLSPPLANGARSQEDGVSEQSADVAPTYTRGYGRGFCNAPRKSQEKVLRKANAQNKCGDSRNGEILSLE